MQALTLKGDYKTAQILFEELKVMVFSLFCFLFLFSKK
jgi:hypothetical protein